MYKNPRSRFFLTRLQKISTKKLRKLVPRKSTFNHDLTFAFAEFVV